MDSTCHHNWIRRLSQSHKVRRQPRQRRRSRLPKRRILASSRKTAKSKFLKWFLKLQFKRMNIKLKECKIFHFDTEGKLKEINKSTKTVP